MVLSSCWTLFLVCSAGKPFILLYLYIFSWILILIRSQLFHFYRNGGRCLPEVYYYEVKFSVILEVSNHGKFESQRVLYFWMDLNWINNETHFANVLKGKFWMIWTCWLIFLEMTCPVPLHLAVSSWFCCINRSAYPTLWNTQVMNRRQLIDKFDASNICISFYGIASLNRSNFSSF